MDTQLSQGPITKLYMVSKGMWYKSIIHPLSLAVAICNRGKLLTYTYSVQFYESFLQRLMVLSKMFSSSSHSSTTLFSLAALGLIVVVFQNLMLQKWPFTSTFSSAEEPFICQAPQYTSRVVSYDPLIIHLENFILPNEREYLINQGSFQPNLSTLLN